MARTTDVSMTRVHGGRAAHCLSGRAAQYLSARAARTLGRRTAQVVLAGALAATPIALGTGIAHAEPTNWDELARCESGGQWGTDTGNGFGGGLQFTDSTWKAFGGKGQPEDASREQQIAVAERVKSEQGMSAWPTCSKKTGNGDSSSNKSFSSSSDDGS